jgi:hypothetical protein
MDTSTELTRRDVIKAFAEELEEVEHAIEGMARIRNNRRDAISDTRWSWNRYIHQRAGMMDVARKLGIADDVDDELFRRAHRDEADDDDW